MVYPDVKRCAACKWSVPDRPDGWNLKCTHPVVNVKDPYYLSYDLKTLGSDCTAERQRKGWRAQCGLDGKLFEPRNDLLKGTF